MGVVAGGGRHHQGGSPRMRHQDRRADHGAVGGGGPEVGEVHAVRRRPALEGGRCGDVGAEDRRQRRRADRGRSRLDIEFKPHSCARPIHNGIDCALAIRAQEKLNLDNIVAIDIAAFGDVDAFKARVDALVRDLRGGARMPGVERIWLPGEQSQAKRIAYARDGIPIAATLMRNLNLLAAELGIAELA